MITLTIDGVTMPLVQVTLRRDSSITTLDMLIAGTVSAAIDDACVLSVDGVEITSSVTSCTPGKNISSITADSDAVVGTGTFEPSHILYRKNDGFRSTLNWTVAPGDTWQGLPITSVTTTIGTSSPAFTEVRF